MELERALKAKMVSTEVLLRKASRGGKRGRMAVTARLRRWDAGDQAGVLEGWARDRARCRAQRIKAAGETRPRSVGGRGQEA